MIILTTIGEQEVMSEYMNFFAENCGSETVLIIANKREMYGEYDFDNHTSVGRTDHLDDVIDAVVNGMERDNELLKIIYTAVRKYEADKLK